MNTKKRRTRAGYDPFFGGIVCVVAACAIAIALYNLTSAGSTLGAARYLLCFGVSGLAWGATQIIAYRRELRSGHADDMQAPTLDGPVSCVLSGLLLAAVSAMTWMFARDHRAYSLASGAMAAVLLIVGGIAGIRRGVWRDPPVQ